MVKAGDWGLYGVSRLSSDETNPESTQREEEGWGDLPSASPTNGKDFEHHRAF